MKQKIEDLEDGSIWMAYDGVLQYLGYTDDGYVCVRFSGEQLPNYIRWPDKSIPLPLLYKISK